MPFPWSVGFVSDKSGFDYFLNAEHRHTTFFEILDFPVLDQPISTLPPPPCWRLGSHTSMSLTVGSYLLPTQSTAEKFEKD